MNDQEAHEGVLQEKGSRTENLKTLASSEESKEEVELKNFLLHHPEIESAMVPEDMITGKDASVWECLKRIVLNNLSHLVEERVEFHISRGKNPEASKWKEDGAAAKQVAESLKDLQVALEAADKQSVGFREILANAITEFEEAKKWKSGIEKDLSALRGKMDQLESESDMHAYTDTTGNNAKNIINLFASHKKQNAEKIRRLKEQTENIRESHRQLSDALTCAYSKMETDITAYMRQSLNWMNTIMNALSANGIDASEYRGKKHDDGALRFIGKHREFPRLSPKASSEDEAEWSEINPFKYMSIHRGPLEENTGGLPDLLPKCCVTSNKTHGANGNLECNYHQTK